MWEREREEEGGGGRNDLLLSSGSSIGSSSRWKSSSIQRDSREGIISIHFLFPSWTQVGNSFLFFLLNLFPLRYMEGGADSALKKAVGEKEKRLYHVKGAKNIRVRQVRPLPLLSSLFISSFFSGSSIDRIPE